MILGWGAGAGAGTGGRDRRQGQEAGTGELFLLGGGVLVVHKLS